MKICVFQKITEIVRWKQIRGFGAKFETPILLLHGFLVHQTYEYFP